MATNIVYLIGDKTNGKFFDAKETYFKRDIGFDSFFPSEWVTELVIDRELGDSNQEYYMVVKAEVIQYANNELEVRYEPFYFRDTF
jgi:hypothetical protein